jgi:hypothetical protein
MGMMVTITVEEIVGKEHFCVRERIPVELINSARFDLVKEVMLKLMRTIEHNIESQTHG